MEGTSISQVMADADHECDECKVIVEIDGFGSKLFAAFHVGLTAGAAAPESYSAEPVLFTSLASCIRENKLANPGPSEKLCLHGQMRHPVSLVAED
jgi:hypothetical protein